jgi:hypothetical protein
MRAIVLEKFGGPDSLVTKEIPEPEPRASPGQSVVPHGIDRGLDPDEMLERGGNVARPRN